MTLSRVRHTAAVLLGGALLGAALLAPLTPPAPASAAPASPRTAPAASAAAPRPTRLSLSAYGDPDASGAVHLSGWLSLPGGKLLGRPGRVELWARTGAGWTRLRTVTTDRAGDLEVRVRPSVTTTYQLRYAGARATGTARALAPTRSRTLAVRAVAPAARVTLSTPATARRGQTFVVTGTVAPAGARRVTLTGDGATFTVLTSRADGSFSGHVRLRQSTRLAVRVDAAAGRPAATSGPRTVRVV